MTTTRGLVKQRKADWQEELAIARMMVYRGEVPVDLRQCQHEKNTSTWLLENYQPEGFSEAYTRIRCDRTPVWLAIQRDSMRLFKSGSGHPKGGREEFIHRPALALCRSCKQLHEHKHTKEYRVWLYTGTAPFKAAYALGGHAAVRELIHGYGT